MKGLIALVAFIACVSAQFKFPFWNRNEKYNHGGYTFEYHDRHHLLIVRDNSVCFLIDAKPDVVKSFKDDSTRVGVEDDIISHIKAKEGKHDLTHFGALTKFHDPLQAAECVRRDIVQLDYTLNSAATSMPDTTMPDTTMPAGTTA